MSSTLSKIYVNEQDAGFKGIPLQEKGQSTERTMSQKSVTDIINEDETYLTAFNKDAIKAYSGYDYSNEVEELYIKENVASASFWVLPDGTLILWFLDAANNINLGCHSAGVAQNGSIEPLTVYYGATTEYPNGTILGCAIMKDIASAKSHPQGSFYENVNFNYCNNLNNCIKINLFLNPIDDSQIAENTIKDHNVANRNITGDKLRDGNRLFAFKANGLSQQHDYFYDVLELYLLPSLAASSAPMLQAYGSTAVFFFKVNNRTYGATTPGLTENGVVYPLTIYHNYDETYPEGTLIGYIVFNDVDDFKSKSSSSSEENVNLDYCLNIKNAPKIAKYLNYYLNDGGVDESKLAMDVRKKISSSLGFLNDFNPDYPDYRPDLLELYIPETPYGYENLTIGFWFNSGIPILWFYNPETLNLGCKVVGDLENGKAYPFTVYYGETEEYPNGTILGYVAFKDKDSAIAKNEGSIKPNVNILYCSKRQNSPTICSQMGIQLIEEEVQEYNIADRELLFPLMRKNYNPNTNILLSDYFDDVQELYLLSEYMKEATDIRFWYYTGGLVVFFTLGSAEYGAQYGSGNVVNDTIYPLSIYWYDGEQEQSIPNGTTIGYVVLKDAADLISKATGNNAPNVNLDYCLNIKNAPKIAKSIGYYTSSAASGVPHLRLPSKIYAVVGDTLQLFYRAILDTWTISNYKIRCICSVGKAFPRYFEYTPINDNIGSTSFGVEVIDQFGNTVASGSTTLQTVSAGVSPANAKNVFIFGDSLTSGGYWLSEMYRRLTGNGGSPAGDGKSNINFCGSMNAGGAHYFGVGGWSWTDYITRGRAGFRFFVTGITSCEHGAVYTNNGNSYTVTEVNVDGNGDGYIRCDAASYSQTPQSSGTLTKSSGNGDATITFTSYAEDSQNPLWDDENDVFTFRPYVNAYGNGQCDVVYTLLSWNALPNDAITILDESSFDTIKGYVKTFADKLHEEYPNAKLKLIGLQCPSLDGGYTSNYGTGPQNWLVDFHGLRCAFYCNKMLQTFANQEGYSDFVEFVDAGFQFDSEYGEMYTMKAVNTRVTEVTEKIGTNGVHPSIAGYNMFADAAYRNFIANFCQ